MNYPTRFFLVSSLFLLPFCAQAQVTLNDPSGVEELLPTPQPASLEQPDTPDEATRTDDPPEEQAGDTPTVARREIEGQPMARGPIHEAFADPMQLTPKPSPTVSKKPPVLIEELRPEIPSTEKNMEWIPGYWGWDEQRDDYVWVSGVWRRVPKGRTWQAGQWQEAAPGDHQWIPGTWLGSDVSLDDEVRAAPPESLEEGPTSPAPSDDHFWIPGVWKSNGVDESKYAWRAGYWTQAYDNWVWVPDHYTWTPTGCRYVSGYWDYPWERRGTLYAPCTFSAADLSGNVCYRPSQVISTSQWLANLWVDPGYDHYCYGDYYNTSYSPWYSYNGFSRGYYDPFYVYYRRTFPTTYGVGLYAYFNGLHNHYAHNAGLRPSVAFYRSNDWQFSRGYGSPFGNVNSLYSYRSNAATRDRLSDLYGRGGGRDGRDYLDRQRARNNYANDRSLDRSREDRNRADSLRRQLDRENRSRLDSSQFRDRDITRGNLNGQRGQRDRSDNSIDRARRALEQQSRQNRVRDSITRDSDGNRNRGNDGSIDRARRALEQQSRQNRVRDSITRGSDGNRNRGNDDSLDRARRALEQQSRRSRVRDSGTRGSNSSSQIADQVNPARQRPTMRTTSPPAVNQARERARAQMQSPASRPRMTPTRPSVTQSRPRTSVAPQRQRPTITQARPSPAPTRSQPSAARARPSAGFSTSGMKRARGADLTRQRDAMKQRMSERKGK